MQQQERITLAQRGEELVAKLLRLRGHQIIARNVHAGRSELDIVALRNRTLVICEVRTRKTEFFGAPAASVDERKQKLLRRGALRLRAEHPELAGYTLRFDVAGVVCPESGTPRIDYYADAF